CPSHPLVGVQFRGEYLSLDTGFRADEATREKGQMTDIWQKLTGKAETKMDLPTAKALLKMKQRLDAQDSITDIFKRLALAEQISKIPPAMLAQADQELAQGVGAPQQQSVHQEVSEDLDFEQLRVAFRDYEQAKTLQEGGERLNVFHGLAVAWVNS